MDNEARKALIERYLEAETTPGEEEMLRVWYAAHPDDEDEWAQARLLELTAPCGGGMPEADGADAEFDRILAAGERKWHRNTLRWTSFIGCAVAAAAALFLWLVPARRTVEKPLSPMQIAEGIQQMMLLDIGDIDSIVATPMGSYAVLTARLKDGNTCSFYLTCNEEDGTPSLLADFNRK